jgi:hypothetical protein
MSTEVAFFSEQPALPTEIRSLDVFRTITIKRPCPNESRDWLIVHLARSWVAPFAANELVRVELPWRNDCTAGQFISAKRKRR